MTRSDLGFPGAETVETPCVVVDRTKLEANIVRARSIVPPHVALRPHAKTHKTLEIAALQRTHGASGITTAKPGEALVFLDAGVTSLNVAYPLIAPTGAARVLRLARQRGADVRFTADSEAGVAALEAAAEAEGVRAQVWLEIDPGFHRCGVDPASPAALAIARRIAASPRLALMGLFSHAGHAYGAAAPDAIADLARAERETMLDLKDRITQLGIAVPGISIGATPTLHRNGGFEGVTEARPGNYVFLDMSGVRAGFVTRDDLALAVVTTVVSANADYAIIDAGSKTLSSDQRAHGAGGVPAGFGVAVRLDRPDDEPFTVAKLSEEHGWIARGGRDLRLGTRLLIYPNHSCVVANLVDELTVLSPGQVERWRVAARGKIR